MRPPKNYVENKALFETNGAQSEGNFTQTLLDITNYKVFKN